MRDSTIRLTTWAGEPEMQFRTHDDQLWGATVINRQAGCRLEGEFQALLLRRAESVSEVRGHYGGRRAKFWLIADEGWFQTLAQLRQQIQHLAATLVQAPDPDRDSEASRTVDAIITGIVRYFFHYKDEAGKQRLRQACDAGIERLKEDAFTRRAYVRLLEQVEGGLKNSLWEDARYVCKNMEYGYDNGYDNGYDLDEDDGYDLDEDDEEWDEQAILAALEEIVEKLAEDIRHKAPAIDIWPERNERLGPTRPKLKGCPAMNDTAIRLTTWAGEPEMQFRTHDDQLWGATVINRQAGCRLEGEFQVLILRQAESFGKAAYKRPAFWCIIDEGWFQNLTEVRQKIHELAARFARVPDATHDSLFARNVERMLCTAAWCLLKGDGSEETPPAFVRDILAQLRNEGGTAHDFVCLRERVAGGLIDEVADAIYNTRRNMGYSCEKYETMEKPDEATIRRALTELVTEAARKMDTGECVPASDARSCLDFQSDLEDWPAAKEESGPDASARRPDR